jgi:23S rRNA (guanine1835-N2)-methyltransferase
VLVWESPVGRIDIIRHPYPGDASHRAWDAADQWILEELGDALPAPEETVILGEDFGALAVALSIGYRRADDRLSSDRQQDPVGSQCVPLIFADSRLALDAARVNLERQGIGVLESNFLDPLQIEYRKPGKADLDSLTGGLPRRHLFVRLPRSTDLLLWYLSLARLLAAPGATVYLGGMDRRWTPAAVSCAESLLGDGRVGRFRKRARWIEYRDLTPLSPEDFEALVAGLSRAYQYAGRSYSQKAGVFSADHLDPGAETVLNFLDTICSTLPDGAVLGDLGCGNGILGIEAAVKRPDITVVGSDVSAMAVISSRENALRHRIEKRASFHWADGFKDLTAGELDAAICNPPFHFANIQTREVALSMFADARRCLKEGGTLFVVGNSHLGYHKNIKEYFNRVRTIHRDNRFILLAASDTR